MNNYSTAQPQSDVDFSLVLSLKLRLFCDSTTLLLLAPLFAGVFLKLTGNRPFPIISHYIPSILVILEYTTMIFARNLMQTLLRLFFRSFECRDIAFLYRCLICKLCQAYSGLFMSSKINAS